MTPQPTQVQQSIPFGEDFAFDLRPRRLRHGNRVLKLERIPLEILLLLLEHPGEIITREEIVARVWGNDVFLDTDNSIRGAIRKVRYALRDDPETPRFIQTVTGRGYRFIAPVKSCGKAEESLASESGTQIHRQPVLLQEKIVDPLSDLDNVHRDKRRQLPRWILVSLTALACVSILAFIGLWRWRSTGSLRADSYQKKILAVLPFDNLSQDPEQEFFSEGLTEEMIAQLGKLNRDQLTVITGSSTARYKGSRLTAREIGQELNAGYLVQGSVQRSADRIRITVQLIDAKNQIDLWTESYDRDLKDVLAVQDSVVRSIASEIHIALTEEQKTRFRNSHQTVPEAYVAYLKGRYHWNRRTGEGIQKAEQYFQEAIDRDPTYAAAYSGLADCNSGLAWHGFKSPADALPKAYAAARKAVEIDPQSAEAHASLGLVLSHRWDWPEAEVEFKRALELDPQYANAHHWYGDDLSIMGRHDEAITEAQRALELDPLNLMISTWAGLRYYLVRNYPAAIKQNQDSVELDPNFAAAHLLLGEDYVQAGRNSEAVSELKRAASLSGDSPLYTAQIAVAQAAAGHRREAIRIAHDLETLSSRRYVSPYALAQIYAELHDDNETFKWLQVAEDDHAVWMGYLASDPVFDRYRSDVRFRNLLRRIGLLASS